MWERVCLPDDTEDISSLLTRLSSMSMGSEWLWFIGGAGVLRAGNSTSDGESAPFCSKDGLELRIIFPGLCWVNRSARVSAGSPMELS